MALLLASPPRADREAVYPVADAEYLQLECVLNELAQQIEDAEFRQLLATVALRREQYRGVFIKVVWAIEANNILQGSALFNGAGLVALNQLLAASESLLENERHELDRR